MKRKTLVIALAIFVVVAASIGFFWPFSDPSDVLVLPGTVEVQEIRLGSKVSGRVQEINVREGETVEAGKGVFGFGKPGVEGEGRQEQARPAGATAARIKTR